jgi:acetyl esterase/lipase
LEEQRFGFDHLLDNYYGHPVPLPEGTRVDPLDVDGIPAEWITPASADADRVILFLHGGGYVRGSLTSDRDLLARLAAAAGMRSLQIDYRLAPEHVFPAALEDAVTAYRWLLSQGARPEHLVVAGESAGGGLALALLQRVRDLKLPMPAAAALQSPWTDLAGTVESRRSREALDPLFTGAGLNALANVYAGTTEKDNPLLSPLYADLRGFPPLRLDVGSDEVVLDDSRQFAERARAAQVPIELMIWEEMWHVFQFFSFNLPEGRESLEQIGTFLRRQTGLSSD